MLDFDLAEMYDLETRILNQAVKRNITRFPPDFMFQLTKLEFENLISQFVTSSWGGIRKLPYAFSEHVVTMLSSVLRSEKAIEINYTNCEGIYCSAAVYSGLCRTQPEA
jgi:hypothetical protein